MASSVTSQTGANPNGTAAATATASAAAQSGKTPGLGIAASFNTFLALLTTQLKNQDPTNAMDTNAMTQQLVSFASVEQQITMNSSLQTLIGLQQASAVTAATPLLGKRVEVTGDQLPLQNGQAMLRLPAKGAATEAIVTIQDAAGNSVFTDTIRLDDTAKDWRWNGKRGETQLPDGAYRVSVAGRTAAGFPQPISATIIGTATSTTMEPAPGGNGPGTMKLNLGAVAVPFSAVRSVGS